MRKQASGNKRASFICHQAVEDCGIGICDDKCRNSAVVRCERCCNRCSNTLTACEDRTEGQLAGVLEVVECSLGICVHSLFMRTQRCTLAEATIVKEKYIGTKLVCRLEQASLFKVTTCIRCTEQS